MPLLMLLNVKGCDYDPSQKILLESIFGPFLNEGKIALDYKNGPKYNKQNNLNI